MLALQEAIESILAFLNLGGPVLLAIAALLFFMWTLIFDRIVYYRGAVRRDIQAAADAWEARSERKSWYARQIRNKLASEVSIKINQNLSLIATCIALCPLLGLLGTVSGMIEVFQVLGITGGGDAGAMAGGVSRATIPTLAGMVAAISGVFANIYLTRRSNEENQLLKDQLVMDL